MSNYLSQPYPVVKPESSINQPLIEKVLTIKQGKYDANKARVEQTLELYKNNLKGLRDDENQYIASKLKEAQNTINSYSNKDYSLSSTTDSLLSSLKSVVEDPIVQNAIKNKALYDNFNQQVSKIKEKTPEKYSDINYQDALDLGGFSDYMKGNTKKLGNLTYKNFVNVTDKLNKKAEEYSKLIGKKQLLDSTSGEYYLTDTYGERVSMQDVYNKLESSLDPDEQEQLKINARQTLGKLDNNTLSSMVETPLKNKIKEYGVEKASLEAELKASTGDKKLEIQNKIDNIGSKISDLKTQVDNKNYDIYSIYKQSILQDIASDYDYELITDVKRDDVPFQMMKFAYQKEKDLANYQLKLREVQAKEKGNTLQEKALLPTITELPKTSDSVIEPAEKLINKELVSSDKVLDAYLKSTNENGYNSKNPSEQWAYKVALKADDPTLEGNDLTRQNLITNFKSAQKGYADLINITTTELKKTATEVYNNIKTPNLNNLAQTMPITVSQLKTGRKFDDLDKNIQKAVMLEIGSSMNLYASGVSDREKTLLEKSLNSIKAQLENHPSEKVKSLSKVVDTTYSRVPKYTYNPNYVSNPLFGINLLTPLKSTSPFSEDTNLSEIDTSEDTNKDANTSIRNFFTSVVKSVDNKAKNIEGNLTSLKAFSFSTEDKNQAPYALKIAQAIQANNPDIIPSDKNNFTLKKEGDKYRVFFTIGSGNKAETTNVLLDKLDEDTNSKFQLAQDSWNKSFLNPNLVLPKYQFEPKNKEENFQRFTTLYKNRPDLISSEVYVSMFNKSTLKGTMFQSPEEVLEDVKQDSRIDQNKLQYIEQILKAKYKPVYSVQNGKLTSAINIEYPDGRRDLKLSLSSLTELDSGRLYMETAEWINKYQYETIESILNRK